MHIIAHRGFWLELNEKNTEIAFTRAVDYGFGIETDFRDFNGKLVISHDIPHDGVMDATEFSKLVMNSGPNTPLAINIKSDGLYNLVNQFIKQTNIKNSFVFDMAIPDMLSYVKTGTQVFTRQSEYERTPVLISECQGVWLDAFESDWYDLDIINAILGQKKSLAIVSPELHGRSYLRLWSFLRENSLHENESISLCTDFPNYAKKYFST